MFSIRCTCVFILALTATTMLRAAETILPDPPELSTAYERGATQANYQNALTYYRAGRYQEAARFLTKVVWGDTRDWQSFEYLGHCYFRLNNTQQALALYERSLLLQNENASLTLLVNGLRGSAALPPVPAVPADTTLPAVPVDNLSAGYASVPPKQNAAIAQTSVKSSGTIPERFTHGTWTRGWIGYTHASVPDLIKGASAWNRVYNESGVASASADKSGFQLGWEGGILFNKHSGLSLDVEYINLMDYRADYSSVYEDRMIRIDPQCLPIYLQYHYFIPGRTMRLSASIGGGYEFGWVHYFEENAYQDIDLDMSGGGWGVQGRITAEWPLNKFAGFHLSLIGRSAVIKNLEADYSSGYGSGRAVLAVDPHGILYAQDELNLNADGARRAKLDLTGFSVVMGISYYFL